MNRTASVAGIAATIAVAGLTGCSSMPPGDGSGGGMAGSHCDGTGVCKVAVSVNRCKIETPVPDPLVVDKDKRNVVIQWELDHASWIGGNTFAADGIVIKDGGSQFDQPDSSGAGKKFSLHDKNDVAGDFKYAIHVKSFWYGDCPVLDPTIKNQG
jgi:hypothetical protein